MKTCGICMTIGIIYCSTRTLINQTLVTHIHIFLQIFQKIIFQKEQNLCKKGMIKFNVKSTILISTILKHFSYIPVHIIHEEACLISRNFKLYFGAGKNIKVHKQYIANSKLISKSILPMCMKF